MLVPCFHCNCLSEDFTMSSYSLVAGGPKVGRVCADCANGVAADELTEYVNNVNEHVLYTADDFKDWSGEKMEGDKLVEAVLDGGLSVCKICGEFEAGLDNPCKQEES